MTHAGMIARCERFSLHVVGDLERSQLDLPGGGVGVVYGMVSPAVALALVSRLVDSLDPHGPEIPWLAVARLTDGTLLASASTMLASGLFWSCAQGVVTVATDPRAAAPRPLRLSADYLRQFVSGQVPNDATPYEGVTRVPAGRTVRWDGDGNMTSVREWCGPSTWSAPQLDGPAAADRYLAAFDGVLSSLASYGSVVTSLSGGLDSSFTAAGLARLAIPGQPILGLVYSPLAGAHIRGAGKAVDEEPMARLLEAAYPGRLVVESVRNEARTTPLAAAAAMADRSGVPCFAPANQVWLDAIRERAREAGAAMWLVSSHGNAALSHKHDYAAAYHLRAGQFLTVARMGAGSTGRWRASDFRLRVLGPLRRSAFGNASPPPRPLDEIGPTSRVPNDRPPRRAFLEWLARVDSGLPAVLNPAAHDGVPAVDPFLSRPVLDVAAAITPAEWMRGPGTRAFARRICEGRVPDRIRFRPDRGQQGRDAWYVICDDRDDYLDRVEAVGTVPGLEGVDIVGLRTLVSRWPWGRVEGPAWPEQVAVDRLLGVVDFAYSAQGWT